MFEDLSAMRRKPEWVPLAEAARLLGVTETRVVILCLETRRIQRTRRRTSLRGVKPQWEYNYNDILAELARQGGVPHYDTDTTGMYVTAAHAKIILNCSIQAVYYYKLPRKMAGDPSRLHPNQNGIRVKPRVRFLHPKERLATGFFLPDVFKLRDDQFSVTSYTHYDEDEIINYEVSVKLRKMPQIISPEAKKTLKRTLKLLERDYYANG